MTTAPDDVARDRDDDEEEPLDPDVSLMVEYLVGTLSPEEAVKVEDRYIEDEAFAEKVQPLVTIWTAKIDFRAAYEAYAAKQKARPAPRPPRRIEETEPEYAHTGPARDTRRWRNLTFLERVDVMYKIGLIALVAITVPSVSTYWFLRFESRHAFVPVGAGGQPIPGMNRSQGVDVPAETRTVMLKNGSRVLVRGGSRFNAVNGVMPGGPVRTYLEGEAAFDISTEEKWVEVITPTGRVILQPGTYAVRCEAACAAMLVTVGVGKAGLRGDSVKTSVMLLDGEHGMVKRGRGAEKVDGSAALGFPVPEVKPRERAPDTGGAAAAKPGRSPRTSR
jgi:hypothetical protein